MKPYLLTAVVFLAGCSAPPPIIEQEIINCPDEIPSSSCPEYPAWPLTAAQAVERWPDGVKAHGCKDAALTAILDTLRGCPGRNSSPIPGAR